MIAFIPTTKKGAAGATPVRLSIQGIWIDVDGREVGISLGVFFTEARAIRRAIQLQKRERSMGQLSKSTANQVTIAQDRGGKAWHELATLDEAMRWANWAVKSGLALMDNPTPEKVIVVMAAGAELGLSAMQSIRSFHIICGKLSPSADLVAALAKRSPQCEYFMLTESTDEVATCETRRTGDPKPTVMSYTIDDARRAGLAGKGKWQSYPAQMLRARCKMALAREVYPDVAMGLYDEDELTPMTPIAPQESASNVVPMQGRAEVYNDSNRARIAEGAASMAIVTQEAMSFDVLFACGVHISLNPEDATDYKARVTELDDKFGSGEGLQANCARWLCGRTIALGWSKTIESGGPIVTNALERYFSITSIQDAGIPEYAYIWHRMEKKAAAGKAEKAAAHAIEMKALEAQIEGTKDQA
jgi:hypothetical protein